jgi:hypothetical protein
LPVDAVVWLSSTVPVALRTVDPDGQAVLPSWSDSKKCFVPGSPGPLWTRMAMRRPKAL